MKKSNLFFAMAFMVGTSFVMSCGSDEGLDIMVDENDALNALEDRTISTATLASGVSIDGAEKKKGSAPSPTGTLDFQIDTGGQEGLQGTGFDIAFSSADDIAGAYVQLLDVDGNKVDGYFDIPSSAFTNGRIGKTVKGKGTTSGRLEDDDDLEINVNFDSTVEPGQFCYEICVYDANDNISAIQKICVEVESWGGNSDVVGEWLFDREEPEYVEDLTRIICDNQSDTLTNIAYQIDVKDEWTFVLGEDGTYYELYDSEIKNLDSELSAQNCEATYGEVEADKDKYSGYWAYNEAKKTFTIVDFKYEDLLDSTNDEVYDAGDVYLDGVTMEIVNDELVLSDTFINANGEVEVEKTIFTRK